MMSHVFDPRLIFFAKHAQHIVLIHFPIALFLTSVLFDLLSWWKHNETLRTVAYYNLVCASLFAVGAAITGVLAWQFVFGGEAPSGIILFHLLGASSTVVLLWLLVALRSRNRADPNKFYSKTYIFLTVITTLLIAVTAHLGGILSGVEQIVP